MGWKPHNLEGCRGLKKISLKGLGLLLNFGRVCRGDTNVSGVHPGAPRCTLVHPGRGSDEGCHNARRHDAVLEGIICKHGTRSVDK